MKKNVFLSLFFCTSLICYTQNQTTKVPRLILGAANTQSPQMSMYQEYENKKSSLKIDLGKKINRGENLFSNDNLWYASAGGSSGDYFLEYNNKEDSYDIFFDKRPTNFPHPFSFGIPSYPIEYYVNYCYEFLYTNTILEPIIRGEATSEFIIKELVIDGKNIDGDLNALWNSGIRIDGSHCIATPVKIVFSKQQNGVQGRLAIIVHDKYGYDDNEINASLTNMRLTKGSTVNTLEVNGNLKVNGKIIESEFLLKRLSEHKIWNKLQIHMSYLYTPKHALAVGGTIYAKELTINGIIRAKELKVEPTGWADFVFDEDYELPSLVQVKDYIAKNRHLPDMPSAQQVKNEGVDIADMQVRLLQKIEELTLYVIDQKNKNEDLVRRAKYLEDILTKKEK